ncbi:hypothetical protein GCM10009801_73300 [Streptomyces albiaxialis]|uniref:DUF4376 domain-containing protein n=1 Tax=Streptomyces albiaxialis TaxID=329523 RepID=A0ABN2WXD6_9ACTN
MPEFSAGQYMCTRTDSDPVRITGVYPWHITYECSDGVLESVDETAYRTLAEQTADWRPATPEEIAAFKARYRPAPVNYLPDDEAAYLEETYGDPDTGERPCHSCGGRRYHYTQAEGQPRPAEAERAYQELERRIAERGVSELDVMGASLFDDLDQLLGDGAQALMEAADTTVWIRAACGCAENLCRVVDINDLEAVNQ